MKHIHQNQEFRFNEVLFEHRNKEYGAYVLRNESDRILTKALFVGVSLLAAISLAPVLINAFKTTEVPIIEDPIYRPIDVLPNDPPKKDPPKEIVKPVVPIAPPNVKQYNSTVVEPRKDAIEPIKIEKPADAKPGLVDNLKGEPINNSYTPPAQVIGNGTVPVKDPVIVQPKEDPNKIADPNDLGAEASFTGGIDSFRNKVMNNFDGSGFDSGDLMKTTVTFIVEKDGTISGIKATGLDADFNNEAVRTIRSIKGKWVPAKNKQGESVRSYFKFPISMKFDQ